MHIPFPIERLRGDRSLPEIAAFVSVGLAICSLVIAPLVMLAVGTLSTSFEALGQSITLKNYAAVYSNLAYYRSLGNTLLLAIGVTVFATTLGAALAWIIGRTNVPGKGMLEVLIMVPLFVSPFLGALGWILALRPGAGVVGTLVSQLFDGYRISLLSPWGIVWVLTLYMAPYAFTFIRSSLQMMDPALEQAAQLVGLGVRQTALHITMPLVSPAILSATLLIFISVMGQFGVPALLGVPANFLVVTTRIFSLISNYPSNWSEAGALSTMLLVITTLGVFLQVWVLGLGLRRFATITGRGFRPGQIHLGRLRLGVSALAWVYVIIAVILPIGSLVYSSFLPAFTSVYSLNNLTLDNYLHAIIDNPRLVESIQNSLLYSVIAATLGVLLTMIAAWIILKSHIPGRRFLEYVCMIPSAIPGSVLAVAFLWTGIWLPIYGTMWIIILAYVAAFIPYGIRVIMPGLHQIDPCLEESGRLSGLNWFRTFGLIVVPLLRSSLVGAWLLLFMIFIKELPISILLYGDQTRVLSVSIYIVWQEGLYNATAALATIQIVLIAGVVILFSRFMGKQALGSLG